VASEYEQPSTPTVTLRDIWNPRDNKLDDMKLPLMVAATLFQTAQSQGNTAVYDMIYLALALRDGQVSHDEANRLWGAAMVIFNTFKAKYHNSREMALDASYEFLRTGYMNREEVAQFASRILGAEVGAEAWRKAVKKWATEQGKPELQLPRGRPSRDNRNTG
jgi:hypothetical protein